MAVINRESACEIDAFDQDGHSNTPDHIRRSFIYPPFLDFKFRSVPMSLLPSLPSSPATNKDIDKENDPLPPSSPPVYQPLKISRSVDFSEPLLLSSPPQNVRNARRVHPLQSSSSSSSSSSESLPSDLSIDFPTPVAKRRRSILKSSRKSLMVTRKKNITSHASLQRTLSIWPRRSQRAHAPTQDLENIRQLHPHPFVVES